MHYSGIHNFDVANGPGIRITIFVSGCRGPFKKCKETHCQECFNKDTWNFKYGKKYTQGTEDEIIKLLSHSHVSGLTLLGGEPMEPENQGELLKLVKRVRKVYPEKSIWIFTGLLFDKHIMEMYNNNKTTKELLNNIDVMVDGPFILKYKDASLRFKGSRNQRTIDLKKSLPEGEIVLLDGFNENLLTEEELDKVYTEFGLY